MSFVIRPAVRRDLNAVLELHAELEFGDRTAVLDVAEAERIFDRMSQYPSYTVYVATIDGEIVGTFALLIMDNLAHRGAPSGIVDDVVVRPSHQGRGIGRRMMWFAMEQCRQAGCYKLALSSNMHREAAHRFYEHIGFEKHGYSYQVLLSPQTSPPEQHSAPGPAAANAGESISPDSLV